MCADVGIDKSDASSSGTRIDSLGFDDGFTVLEGVEMETVRHLTWLFGRSPSQKIWSLLQDAVAFDTQLTQI